MLPHEILNMLTLVRLSVWYRYGNLKGGASDIKAHKWFRDINWLDLYNRKVVPTFVPTTKGPGDASQFEYYDEEPLKPSSVVKFSREFADF